MAPFGAPFPGFQRPPFSNQKPVQTMELLNRKLSSNSAADLRASAQFEKSYAEDGEATAVGFVMDLEWKGLNQLCQSFQATPAFFAGSVDPPTDQLRAREIAKVYSMRWPRKVHDAWMAMCKEFIEANQLDKPVTVEKILRSRRMSAATLKAKKIKSQLNELREKHGNCDFSDGDVNFDDSDTEPEENVQKNEAGAAASSSKPARATSSDSRKRGVADDVTALKSSVIGLAVKSKQSDGSFLVGVIESVSKTVESGWQFQCKFDNDTVSTVSLDDLSKMLALPQNIASQKLEPFKTVIISTPQAATRPRQSGRVAGIKVPKFKLDEPTAMRE